MKEGNFCFPQTEMPSPSTFYLGFLDLPRHWVPVWCSVPDSNPCLTRQPHGLCAFSFLFPLLFFFLFLSFSPFFPLPFFLFLSFFFLKFHPGMFPSLHPLVLIPSYQGYFSSWPGGAGLLTENAALSTAWCECCGLLAQSNPLGEVGQERLWQRGEQRAALCSLNTKAKYSAHRWDQAWVWWLCVAPHLGWAKWHRCYWHVYKVRGRVAHHWREFLDASLHVSLKMVSGPR